MARTRADVGWKPFRVLGPLACCLLTGCGLGSPAPLPSELSEAGVRARLLIPTQDIPAQHVAEREPIVKTASEPEPESERSVFTLSDAVAYAQRHNPRLRAARAAIESTSGQEQAAFAAFLPDVTIFS